MLAYLIRRLLLMIPTLLGIMILNFIVIQFAPGGPIEQMLAELQGTAVSATARFSGEGTEVQSGAPKTGTGSEGSSKYRGARGLDPKFIKQLEVQFGFDKPAYERFLDMIRSYVVFDFGKSFFKNRPAITAGSAIPGFLFAILLIVVFAGGRYLDWFPLRGLTSPNWHDLSWPARILDYLWHMKLPIVAMVSGSFASLTLLTKNSFLDQMRMLYVSTARAKGLNEHQVLYGHVFRNAVVLGIC